ncbi:porin family protein [Flavobacterium sp. RHBU_3]|uniref:porin family protein n=1 Tax=Flavobacterium sp. RHBU_3 TaxID=3391184 RepID=UPI003984AED4
MKKIIFTAAILAAMCFSANAQKIKLGVKAGLNISQFTGDVLENNFTPGVNAGFVAEFKLTNWFSLQPELLYNRQGNKTIINEYYGTEVSHEKYFDKLDYISLPVLAKFYIYKGLSIEAGPQIAYLTGAKRKVEYSGYYGDGSLETPVNSEFEKADIGFVSGIAYDLPMGLFFQARYISGILDISATPDIMLNNETIAFSAGYKF